MDKDQEETRGKIAMRLMWLLMAVVGASFVTIWIDMACGSGRGATAVKDLLQLVLGPIITLLGTVTGFYFGAQSRNGTRGAPRGEA